MDTQNYRKTPIKDDANVVVKQKPVLLFEGLYTAQQPNTKGVPDLIREMSFRTRAATALKALRKPAHVLQLEADLLRNPLLRKASVVDKNESAVVRTAMSYYLI